MKSIIRRTHLHTHFVRIGLMLVLGIETSGLQGTVALLRDETCLGERHLNQAGHRHAQSLVLEIGDLLRTHSVTSHDVDLIAVSRGPGSFTGLRVGMVCAKTFAYAARCRFISVDTFAAIAENVPTSVDRLFVVEDAQREDLFVGEYARDADRTWTQVAPIQICSAADFVQARSESDIVTGPGVNKRDLAVDNSNWLKDLMTIRPRASVIALLGQRDFMKVGANVFTNETDFWRASPFYIRLSAAEEKRALNTEKVV